MQRNPVLENLLKKELKAREQFELSTTTFIRRHYSEIWTKQFVEKWLGTLEKNDEGGLAAVEDAEKAKGKGKSQYFRVALDYTITNTSMV
ncbi:hypothetical protein ACMFMF_008109 [Clarireedia jacksonii]